MKRGIMKRIALLLVAVATIFGFLASISQSGRADEKAAPIFVTQMPPGYRDWKFVSVAHEAGNLNSIGAVLGNDVAIKAYREGKLPFPDGTIIAALHFKYVPSEENNKVFGRSQSFVAQGLEKVRRDGRLGVRSLQQRRYAWGRGVHATRRRTPPTLYSPVTLPEKS
jgi:hypothetical protein